MISAADLFCGAGGTSGGLQMACRDLGLDYDLVAVNHWPTAVATHEFNHPNARHYCADLGSIAPRRCVPNGTLDLLVASPECTHHSKARGGKPVTDQKRASAWHVLRWAEELRPREILVENVPEFQSWGPVDDKGTPVPEYRGRTYAAWTGALESLGYDVEARVLNCADYGDPTSRKRLFVRASLDRVAWPKPTHGPVDENGEPRYGTEAWRTAREIIDWTDLGTSIFQRKKPLAPRTIERIKEGIRRFCGELAEPFLLLFYGQSTVASLDDPLPTVTANEKFALIHPFLLPHRHAGKNGHMVDPIDAPYRTVTASNGADNYLVTPFMVPHMGERPGQTPRTHSVDEPLPTVTASKGSASLVSPFLVPYYGTGVPDSINEPLATVTTRDRFALVSPVQVRLDILFRMLKPTELAQAQGFPESYQFAGRRKKDVVAQIGNAVPRNTAAALIKAALEGRN